jgi:hypothetical protein
MYAIVQIQDIFMPLAKEQSEIDEITLIKEKKPVHFKVRNALER